MDYKTRQRLNEAEKSIKRIDRDVFKMGRMIADHDTTIGKLIACADDVPHLASDVTPKPEPQAGKLIAELKKAHEATKTHDIHFGPKPKHTCETCIRMHAPAEVCSGCMPGRKYWILRAVPAWTPEAGEWAWCKVCDKPVKLIKHPILSHLTGHFADNGIFDCIHYQFRPLTDEDWVVKVGGVEVSAKWTGDKYIEVTYDGLLYGYGKTPIPAVLKFLADNHVPIRPFKV
jgi:hypothetical protein